MKENYDLYLKDTLEDGEGIRSARKFMGDFSKAFMDEALQFYSIWEEFPFTYRERQVNSVVVPAIHAVAKNVWMEQPFKKSSQEQRFLDLVTTHGKNIYLIELKHSWNSYTEDIAKYTDNEWEKGIEQIGDIHRKSVGDYFDYNNFNVFKIALMIMPTFLYADNKHAILDQSAEEYVLGLFDQYNAYRAEKFRPNLIGAAKLHEPAKYMHDFGDGERIYPFISFVARFEYV